MNISALKSKMTTALHLGRALQVVWRYASGWTLFNGALVFLQGLFPLAAFYLMKRIVDTVTLLLANPPDKTLQQNLAFWVALAVTVAFFSAVANALREYTGEAQSQILSDKVADILHEKSIALDLSYYEDPSYFDTLHRAQAEAPYRLPRIVQGLIAILQNSISLLGILALLFSFSGMLVLVLFLAALPVAIARLHSSRKAFQFERSITEPERRAWYYHTVMTDSMAAKELRMFDFGSLFRSRFQELKKEIRGRRLDLVRSRMIWDIFSQILIVFALFGSVLWIAYQTVQGRLSLGDLVAFYLAFQGGLSYLQATFRALAGLYEDNLFLANLYEFLELKPVIVTPERPEKVASPLKNGIVFDSVGFSYPGSSHAAVQDIDLTIGPNQIIALVGDNGSGKTTLVKLLSRLYDPSAGTITVDGIDLKSVDPAAWRKQISVIFQDYAHYALKVWENIWLGNIEAPPDMSAITDAARHSGAASFIESLPDSYNTELGRWFCDGMELSTGEWQKIALARTLWRDAGILVFDEPNSALDPLAEEALFNEFRALLKGRCAILVTHRFATLQLADFIYVMRNGRIAEKGTHRDLLDQNGHYARFYQAQAKHYRGQEPVGE